VDAMLPAVINAMQVFVESSGSELDAVDFSKTQLYQLLDRFDNTIRIRIHLPPLNGSSSI